MMGIRATDGVVEEMLVTVVMGLLTVIALGMVVYGGGDGRCTGVLGWADMGRL